MLIYDPYKTSIGNYIPTEKLREQLVKFVTVNRNNHLNYEYNTKRIMEDKDGVELIFITGKNEDEKDIPVFEHPILIEDVDKNKYVVTDIRKYIKKLKPEEDVHYIKDIAKSQEIILPIILRSLITAEIAGGSIGEFRQIFSNIILSYSSLISNLLTSAVMLNPLEKWKVEVVTAMYITAMLSEDGMEVVDPVIIGKYKFSLPGDKKAIKLLYTLVADIEPKSTDDLVNMIKAVLPDAKQSILTTGLLTNIMSSLWYGPGGVETMLMSNEHIGTLISLYNTAVNDKTFKKSRLSTMLMKDNKRTKLTDIDKKIKNYIKECTYDF